ncbi:MAG: RidA family protein [Solirubrobacteraceae bacterium]
MGDRHRLPPDRPWSDSAWGYSRAVRVGRQIEVSGTTALTDAGVPIAPGDAHEQTLVVLGVIVKALRELGAEPEDVVRTRAFVTNIADFPDVGRAHAKFFGDIRPASTCVAVTALVHPELCVEIEATAILAG